ncbi:MAG: phosphonoacetaldehyde reductase [Nanoarchaeota archaeon]
MKQIEYSGYGSLNKLASILKKHKPKHIFLATGNKSFERSGADITLNKILSGYKFVRYSGFEENPRLENVQEAIGVLVKDDYDFVVAVGGGSIIDSAKIANSLSSQSGKPLDYIVGKRKISKRGRIFVAIPTTAGSGSEATHFTVVYVNGIKYSLADSSILPNYSISDSKLTMSLPKKVTASSGMDALAQAVESFWCINSTIQSKSYSRKAIKLIVKNLENAVNAPNKSNRIAIMTGSHLVGKAINITKTTAPHAISYPLTMRYGISHGHAVGLTLGKIFAYNSGVTDKDVTDKRGAKYVRNSISELCTLLGVKDAKQAEDKINSLMSKIGLETNMGQLGIKPSEELLNEINSERLVNNPRLITKQDVIGFLND